MKNRILLCIGICLTTNFASAQKLVHENYIWSCSVQGTESDKYITEHTTFRDVTEINGVSYLKVYESITVDPYSWKYTNKLIREENDRVYLLHEQSSEEELLYDFSLKQGDTFINRHEELVRVDSIVKQQFGSEELNVHYLSVENNFPIRWIEKLGTDFSVLEPYGALIVGAWKDMLCLECDGKLVYQNSNFGVCHRDNTTDINDLHETQYIEFDNPVSGTLSVHNSSGIAGKIILYNLQGQQISSTKINHDITEICLPQNGPIIYRYETVNGRFQKGKLFIK